MSAFEASAPKNAGKAEDLSGSNVPMTSGEPEEIDCDDAFANMGLHFGRKKGVQPRSIPQKSPNPPSKNLSKEQLDYYRKEFFGDRAIVKTRPYDNATMYINYAGQVDWIKDKNGNLIYKVDSGRASLEFHAYNESGNCTRDIIYDMNGELNSFTDYLYDKDGKITDKVTYNAKNKVSEFTEYHYDILNRLEEERTFDSDNKITNTVKHSYDN